MSLHVNPLSLILRLHITSIYIGMLVSYYLISTKKYLVTDF